MEKAENLSVNKESADSLTETVQSFSKLTSTWANASLEFFANMLEAGANSTRTFVNVVDCEKVTLDQFPGKLVNGIAESNVTFFKHLSASSQKFNDSIKSASVMPAHKATVEIDYERLAKMVAEEMKKPHKS
jgi:hypothetical protein